MSGTVTNPTPDAATQAAGRFYRLVVTEDQATTMPPLPNPTPHKRRGLPSGFATLRDLGTFCIGMAIIVNEVFLSPKVEPAAVAIGLAMTGLPLVFGADERRNRDSNSGNSNGSILPPGPPT